MKYKVLKTEIAYNNAIQKIEQLFSAKPGSEAFDELELLTLLVKDYEDRHFPMPEPDPIAVIKLKMEDLGLKNKDLIPIIGSESHVSSVLSGRRKLTLDMVRSLASFLKLPSWVFINDRYGLERYAPQRRYFSPHIPSAEMKPVVYAHRVEKKPKKA